MQRRQQILELSARNEELPPDRDQLLLEPLGYLTWQAEGELQYGMAPSSSCERALKKLLADMGDSDVNTW